MSFFLSSVFPFAPCCAVPLVSSNTVLHAYGTMSSIVCSLAPQDKAKLKVKVKLNLHSIVSLESVQQIDEADVEEPVTETPAPEASEAAPEAMAEDGAEAPAPANGEVCVCGPRRG